jgi:hypothetical protein
MRFEKLTWKFGGVLSGRCARSCWYQECLYSSLLDHGWYSRVTQHEEIDQSFELTCDDSELAFSFARRQ